MSDIGLALQLYDLMASRMERDGFCDNQAKVYRETIEFMKDCETAEEATEKIKGSPLYLAPSIALMKDKLLAQIAASKENRMPKLAEVYEKQLSEVNANSEAINNTGYHVTAQNVKIHYLNLIDAFCKIYESYVLIYNCAPGDTDKLNSEYANIKSNFAIFQNSDISFDEFTQIPEFREMILSNDKGYADFLDNIKSYQNALPDRSSEIQSATEEAQKEWGIISAMKDEIIAIGKENLKKSAAASVIVVPPENSSGSYTYIDEEVHP